MLMMFSVPPVTSNPQDHADQRQRQRQENRQRFEKRAELDHQHEVHEHDGHAERDEHLQKDLVALLGLASLTQRIAWRKLHGAAYSRRDVVDDIRERTSFGIRLDRDHSFAVEMIDTSGTDRRRDPGHLSKRNAAGPLWRADDQRQRLQVRHDSARRWRETDRHVACLT
jgi:hypothetical protein